MKKNIFLGIFCLQSLFFSYGQLATENGYTISPNQTLFVLNIFVNINYDLCSTCDPYDGEATPD